MCVVSLFVELYGEIFHWNKHRSTYISSTMTKSDLNSKASTHCTSFGWCRSFMIAISCRTFSLSLADNAFINFPAHTFLFDFSVSLNTVPNFPLKQNEDKKWLHDDNWWNKWSVSVIFILTIPVYRLFHKDL